MVKKITDISVIEKDMSISVGEKFKVFFWCLKKNEVIQKSFIPIYCCCFFINLYYVLSATEMFIFFLWSIVSLT